jgi:hypothetical protein
MSLVMGWVARSRKSSAPAADGSIHVLRTTLAYPILGYLIVALCLFATVASSLSKTTDWTVPVIFLAFSLLGAPLVVEGHRVRHEITPEGIRYRGMIKETPELPWRELRSAKYASVSKWLVVETETHGKLRFSAGLNGWQTLARALLEHVPDLPEDEETRRVLADARDGNLPSIWR